MSKLCTQCGRPVGLPHHYGKICDTVQLSDGRIVHASRIEPGGNLHDLLGPDLKIVHRNITPSMREDMRKAA